MRLLQKTRARSPPGGATHWTCRTMAEAVGVSKASVQRIWTAFGSQPRRQKHCPRAPDPFFVEKVRAIVGLYLHPPDQALVLCVDEKSPTQARERTQPLLPLGLGYVEIWFHIGTQKVIRRGSCASVTQLKERILRFTDHYNPGARPFLWTATADSMLHKIQRLCMTISETQH